jgi:SET domain-containing protein
MFIILISGLIATANSLTGGSQRPHKRDLKPTPRPTVSSSSYAHVTANKDSIEILPAPDGKGMGAFAAIDFLKGEWIGEYTGEYMNCKEVEARYWGKRKANRHDRKWRNNRKRRDQGLSGDYLFALDDGLYIDGEDADVSSWCRFANHASPRNEISQCNTETWSVSRGDDGVEMARPQLWFKALRDIDAGEEICYDYGISYWERDN